VSNKIGGSLDSGSVRVDSGRGAKRSSANSTASADQSSANSAEGAQITDSARTLATLEQSLRDTPAIDEARVESVRNNLANGSYKVNAERVADKLLQSEQELARFE
jgi:negative regulator of flagellin synthesis FlgM